MSNTRQAGSQKQPSSGRTAPKAKKERRRQGRGAAEKAKTEYLSPISKYLVKEDEPLESPHITATAITLPPSVKPDPSSQVTCVCSSQENDPSPDTEATSSTTGVDAPTELLNPKPPKAVKKHGGTEGRGKRVTVKKEEESNDRDDSRGPRVQQSGGRSRGGQAGRGRGRRVARTQDNEYAPTRRQIQPTITDHFPVRRSGRRCKSEIENEAVERMAHLLRTRDESGLKVVEVEGKGRGVVSTRPFSRGELVCEYSGELISHEEAKRREEEYGRDTAIGCYMYYFTHKTSKLCVDATVDNGRKGRLLNHSRTTANVVSKLLEVDGEPYLCLVAARDISPGEELQYDYGERDKEALDSHPWLAT